MYPNIESLLHAAEESYLQDSEIQLFCQHVSSLSKRVELYELLRDREEKIFQRVIDRLVEAYPKEKPATLERAIRHWVLVMRHCAMAMLCDNPDLLQRRLLEWLIDIVKAHSLQAIENDLCQLLQMRLKKELNDEQWVTLRPFVLQAQRTLLTPNVHAEATT